MKAARIVGPRRFEFLDIPTPEIKPGEVLVRLDYASVCGSDLRSYDRTLPEEDYPLPIGRPCHEAVGTVEQSTDDRFRKGQKVIAVTSAGSLVEYQAADASLLVPLPPEVDDIAPWVLCQPCGTVIYAMQRLGSVIGKSVVVLGQGPIGLFFTDLLARGGATQVIVTDKHDYRLDAAKKVGATHTINAGREDVVARVAEITGGRLADASVEACGRPETFNQSFEVIRQFGTVIVFGMAHTEDVIPFDFANSYNKLPTVIVTNSAMAGERVACVQSCVDLVNQGRLDVSYMITHRYKFDQLQEAYDVYSAKRENSLKLILDLHS